MIGRTVFIRNRCYIKSQNDQLILESKGDDSSINSSTFAIEDIGLLMIESTQVTFSANALIKLASNNTSVIFCDESHHPSVYCAPFSGNTLHTERIRSQIALSIPAQKTLWKQIIQAKLKGQADVLKYLGYKDGSVRGKISKVLSGDATNQEGAAARNYWEIALSPYDVLRGRDEPYPNNLLNYGYAIVRASVARGIIATGLHPALGIKHSNRNNAFALADDVIEVFRPFVDYHVLTWAKQNGPIDTLQPDLKKYLLGVLTVDALFPEGTRPLWNAIELICAKVGQYYSKQLRTIDFPKICE